MPFGKNFRLRRYFRMFPKFYSYSYRKSLFQVTKNRQISQNSIAVAIENSPKSQNENLKKHCSGYWRDARQEISRTAKKFASKVAQTF